MEPYTRKPYNTAPAYDHRPVSPRPYFDLNYLKDIEGFVRLLEVIFSLASLISISIVNYAWWPVYIGCMLTVCTFAFSLILLCFYLFHLVELTEGSVNYLKLELYYTAACIPVYLMIMCTMIYGVVRWSATRWSWGFATVCCFFCLICFAIDFKLQYDEWKQQRQDSNEENVNTHKNIPDPVPINYDKNNDVIV